jgi:hypothetical protein
MHKMPIILAPRIESSKIEKELVPLFGAYDFWNDADYFIAFRMA